MKVCDRCGGKFYGSAKIGEQEFDFCHEHYSELMKYVTTIPEEPEKRKPGRPRKNSEKSE